MSTRRNTRQFPPDDPFALKRRKPIPHTFVLDALAELSPVTRPMFGCTAIYVEEKIVLILREKADSYPADNGVWLATTKEHHDSLRREFPNMRSIGLFGKKETAWQVLPSDCSDFEQAAVRACELVIEGDPRIGKIPNSRSRTKKRKSAAR